MSSVKVAISIESDILNQLDNLVSKSVFPNRSKAISIAVTEKLTRLEHNRLAVECAKLDPREEKILAEEGLGQEMESWPEY